MANYESSLVSRRRHDAHQRLTLLLDRLKWTSKASDCVNAMSRRRYRQALRHDEPYKFDSVKRKIRKRKRKTVGEQLRYETESEDDINNISIQEVDSLNDNNFVEFKDKGDQHDLTDDSQAIFNEFHCSVSGGCSSSSNSSEESDIDGCDSDNISLI